MSISVNASFEAWVTTAVSFDFLSSPQSGFRPGAAGEAEVDRLLEAGQNALGGGGGIDAAGDALDGPWDGEWTCDVRRSASACLPLIGRHVWPGMSPRANFDWRSGRARGSQLEVCYFAVVGFFAKHARMQMGRRSFSSVCRYYTGCRSIIVLSDRWSSGQRAKSLVL